MLLSLRFINRCLCMFPCSLNRVVRAFNHGETVRKISGDTYRNIGGWRREGNSSGAFEKDEPGMLQVDDAARIKLKHPQGGRPTDSELGCFDGNCNSLSARRVCANPAQGPCVPPQHLEFAAWAANVRVVLSKSVKSFLVVEYPARRASLDRTVARDYLSQHRTFTANR